MKKAFRFFITATAIVTAVVACQKEKNFESTGGVEINIIADGNVLASDTKTAAVDGETPYVKWLDTDALKVLEVVDGVINDEVESSGISLSDGDQVATFRATLTAVDPVGSSYKYAAVYPASALSKGGNAPNEFYRLTIPSAQHLIGNNFAADADLLISTLFDNGSSRVASDQNVSFQFRRVGTAIKLTLKGITAGEKIQKVIITAPEYIAGLVKYTPETSSLVTDSWHYANGSKTITLTLDDLTATGTDVIWFRVLAASNWAANSKLAIEVETDQANYYRNGKDDGHAEISLNQEIKLIDGGLTAFGINLSGKRVEKTSGTEYTKVTNDNEIGEGPDYLVAYLASAEASTSTVLAPITGSNGYTGIVADVAVSSNTITIYNEAVQIVTLESAANDGEFYVLFGNQYLSCRASNASLSLSDTKDADGYDIWTVTPSGIVNTKAKKNETAYEIRFNSSANPKRFANYAGSQGAITLFKHGAVTTLEDPSLVFSLNSSPVTDPINVAWAEKESFVAPTLTKPDGLTATYSSSNVAVATVDANTGAIIFVGNGTTTITATTPKNDTYKSGNASYTLTVTGAPAAKGESEDNPFSVAEALSIIEGLENGAANRTDVRYVRGIISAVSSFNSSYNSITYNISADGNDTNTITVYSGKGVDGADFSSLSDLSVGYEVVVKGQLMKYGSSNTPQIYQSSEIVTLTIPPHFTASLTSDTIGCSGGNITLNVSANVAWTASIDNSATLKIGENDPSTSVSGDADASITVIIPENNAGATYTLSFSTSSTEVTAPADKEITQLAKSDTDVLTYSWTGLSSGSSYTSWSGKEGTSTDAVYAGQSFPNGNTIQLRATSPSGIVSTTSGGYATKVTVVWNSSTAGGRTLDVYGSNTAYSGPEDLYGDNAGTLIGQIVFGTSTELTIPYDCQYIGLRSNSNSMYFDEIRIKWSDTESGNPIPTPTYNVIIANCTNGEVEADMTENIEAGETVTLTVTPDANYTLASLTVDGNVVTNQVSNGTYSFVMPTHNVNVSAEFSSNQQQQTTYTWVKTAASSLATGDEIVIVDATTGKAMSNNNGTGSAPSATAVAISNDKNTLSGQPATTLVWTVTVSGGSYTFGTGTNHLYCTNTNNGVRVGTNSNSAFTFESNFLKNTVTERWIGVYNSQDWRCYSGSTPTGINNIKNTVVVFYKKTADN